MRKLTRSLIALTAVSTVAFAGTGVASAQSSEINDINQIQNFLRDFDPLAELPLEELSSDPGRILTFNLSAELEDRYATYQTEQKIDAAADNWARSQGREWTQEAQDNAGLIHGAAIRGEYEEFDVPEQEESRVFFSFDFDRGTFIRAPRENIQDLFDFLGDEGAGDVEGGYGLIVSSDAENFYLTIGVS